MINCGLTEEELLNKALQSLSLFQVQEESRRITMYIVC